MPRTTGAATRRRILDAAEILILENGYAGTSLERLIERAGVTKGTFFYHFGSKAELAHALVERYAELDNGYLTDHMARAERLASDPLEQLLVFIGLFQEQMEDLTDPYPGCLFGSYCYEAGLFDDKTLAVIHDTMLAWRLAMGAKLREAAAARPPQLEVDLDSLADMITVVFEGAFIVSKTLKDPRCVAEQLGHYRNYLRLLFAGA